MRSGLMRIEMIRISSLLSRLVTTLIIWSLKNMESIGRWKTLKSFESLFASSRKYRTIYRTHCMIRVGKWEILDVLDKCKGSVKLAAMKLGFSERGLRYRLQRYCDQAPEEVELDREELMRLLSPEEVCL